MQSTFQSMLNEHQLSERIGVPVGTLRNWRGELGRGPKSVKLGSGPKAAVRYRLSDVIEWENSLPYKEASATKQNALDEVERVA